ncbi:carboxymuconolactone decarboxylase family protein [Hoeflea sp.]|uniref:carboxymuconolactone decarboxylase family protein n=1 Tax=Hoeflea sp. TaxID=1940281 RepID=UPI003B01E83E
MSAWIKMIDESNADEDLLDALAMAQTPHGTVDNVMRVHSLRPATMRGHVLLYRAALHDDTNTLPPWLQETVASYVSLLNGCAYSYANHWANARHLIASDARADAIEKAMRADRIDDSFNAGEAALLRYARKLTLEPGTMVEDDVRQLRAAGFDDGQILEANQIVGYFNYVNRSLNGLGVTTQGDVVGYYAENSAV